MKVTPIHRETVIENKRCVMILGFFDGVHRGHQAVIETGVALARKRHLPAVVMTFNHHPSIVFHKQPPFKYLSAIPYKWQYLSNLGVDEVQVVDFTSQFASLSPQDFVQHYIINAGAEIVVTGFDYTYGRGKTATADQLSFYANQQFEVVIVDALEENDEKISSTYIRQALKVGDIEKANQALGYLYETHGIVIHGDARGRTLGFPTANIQMQHDELLPGLGVYVVEIKIGNQWYQGMASIGHNITFGDHFNLSVEINILNFDEEIYGESVAIRWHHRLRSEKKFDNVNDLIRRLEEDKIATASYFEEIKI